LESNGRNRIPPSTAILDFVVEDWELKAKEVFAKIPHTVIVNLVVVADFAVSSRLPIRLSWTFCEGYSIPKAINGFEQLPHCQDLGILTTQQFSKCSWTPPLACEKEGRDGQVPTISWRASM
jgi:hypothetical protein